MSGPNSAHTELLHAILHRSTVDRQFRQRLIAEPRQAIEAAFGLKLVNGFRIKFLERGPDVDALIVLPDFCDGDGTNQ